MHIPAAVVSFFLFVGPDCLLHKGTDMPAPTKTPEMESVADLSLETAKSLMGGTSGATAAPKRVDVEHMDFAYLRTCEDGQFIESFPIECGYLML